MKFLCALLMSALAVTACSSSTVIGSVTPAGSPAERETAAASDETAPLAPTGTSSELLQGYNETAPATSEQSPQADGPSEPDMDGDTAPGGTGQDVDVVDPPAREPDPTATERAPAEAAPAGDPADSTSPEATPAPEDTGGAADTTTATEQAQPREVAVHWCDGPAERVRDAFADTIWADRPEGMPLEQALNGVLVALIAARPSAPEELEQTLTDAIESQVQVNAALAAVDWDLGVVDWSTVTSLDLNEVATIAIDEYSLRICGLRQGFLVPANGAPGGGREVNENFEDLVEEVVAEFGLNPNDARCLVAVMFEYGVVASDEVSEALLACGVPLEKLSELVDG